MLDLPCTMSLMRAGFTSMSRASRFWLMPPGFMNSSARISPGGIESSFFAVVGLSDNDSLLSQRARHRLRLSLDNLQQNARAAFRAAAALLPIAHCGDCKSVGGGEAFL